MRLELVDVECYSGYRANERPVAFTFRGRRRQVAEIVDRWFEGGTDPLKPALDYFKVRTEDGRVYFLRYNALFDKWAICLFENHRARKTPPLSQIRKSGGARYR